MRKPLVVAIVLLVWCAQAPISRAGLVSKSYEFRAGVILEVGATTDDGLRIDTVRFQMPSNTAVRTVAQATVEVTISNSSNSPKKTGVAVALFDAEGRMVAVAGGGTKLMPLKVGRQKTYKLLFDTVNTEAAMATTFQISVESKP